MMNATIQACERKMIDAGVDQEVINKVINSGLSERSIMTVTICAIDRRNIDALLVPGLNDDQISALSHILGVGCDAMPYAKPELSADEISSRHFYDWFNVGRIEKMIKKYSKSC